MASTRFRDAREQVKIGVRSVLLRRGLDVVRHPLPARVAAALRAFDLDAVIDVGANVGQYAASLRSAGYRGRIVSCEPMTDAFNRLERRAAGDPSWSTLRVAIGDRQGETSINISANSYSSSLMPMTAAHTDAAPGSEYVAEEGVTMTTLAAVIDSERLDPARTWLKIDTQGFESRVLDGAGELLDSFAAVQLELSFVPLYEGQDLFDDLVGRLVARGMTLYGIDGGFSDPRTGRTLQCDGVFVRNELVDALGAVSGR